MKKITFTFLAIFSTLSIVYAQSDNVSLKVKLNPIQTIVVNPAQKNVDLVYQTEEDYADGVSSTQPDHLKIYSTGAFAVTVQSDADDIVRTNGSETIAAAGLTVKASEGSTNALTGAVMDEVALSTTPTNLISSSTGGADKNFNVTYSGLGTDAYINRYFDDENPTVYTTVVTYTIAAQ